MIRTYERKSNTQRSYFLFCCFVCLGISFFVKAKFSRLVNVLALNWKSIDILPSLKNVGFQISALSMLVRAEIQAEQSGLRKDDWEVYRHVGSLCIRPELQRVCLTVSCHDTMMWLGEMSRVVLNELAMVLESVYLGWWRFLLGLMKPSGGSWCTNSGRFLLPEPAVVPLPGTGLCDQRCDRADQLMALQVFFIKDIK